MPDSTDRPLLPRRLVYDPHAVQRMQQRGFSHHDVKLVLYTGAVAESSFQPKQGPYRHARELRLRGKRAKVIFTIWPDYYYIVTVEWVWEDGK